MQARLSIQDVGYNGLTDSVKFGKILSAMRLLKSSDCYYVRIRQLAVVVLFPFVIVAAFFYLVVRVSLCIAKEVMGGKYISLTITITATSREHLDNFYRALTSHPLVKYAL